MSFNVRPLEKKPGLLKIWTKRIAAILTVAEPLLHFYGSWKKQHDKDRKQQKRIGMLKRVLTMLIALLLAFVLLGGIVKAIMSIRGIGVTEMIGAAGVAPPKDRYGYTNILLLGEGDASHDGKDLTDTVMIASIDPNTESVTMLSLPRDLYFLGTDKMGKGKLNTFYRDYKSYLRGKGMKEAEASQEAMKELEAEIGRTFGIDVHHAVKVDFIGFVQAVDAIGGVDVDVPYDIDDEEYPDLNYGFQPFILKAGLRHMDGETALKYARSRHTTSDFGRSARQQQLLSLLADKAKSEGLLRSPGEIASLYRIVAEHTETTMNLREILGLAAVAEKIDRSKIVSLQLSDRNALYDSFIEPGGFLYTPPRDQFDGAAVLLPVSIPPFPVTWKQIRTFVSLLMEHRDLYLAKPAIAVLNAGAPPGSGRKLGNELTRYGFNVERTENAGATAKAIQLDSSLIVQSAEGDPMVDFFGTFLGLTQKPSPDSVVSEKLSRITIILGKDYKYTPIQDLIKNIAASEKSPITNN